MKGVFTLRALLIDMDGTLVETETRWWSCEIKVMQNHGSTWDEEDQNQAVGGPLERVIEYMAAKSNSNASEIFQEVVDCVHHSFVSDPPKLQPGWKEIFIEAKKMEIPMVLVTASNRYLADALLASSNLEEYFAFSVTSDDLPRTKPHPDPYLHACEVLKLDPKECLVFEDSNTGVTSSLGAGIPTIALPERVLLDSRIGMKILKNLAGLNISDLNQIHQELLAELNEL